MNDREKVDKTRRTLVVATSVAGGVATVAAAAPFAVSMWPSERAKAAGAPVEADVATLQPGELRVYEWRGKPVWVFRRSKEMLESLKVVEPYLTDPGSKYSEQPKYAKNENRSEKPDVMVLIGVCTHLGCSPQMRPAEAKAEMGADWMGGDYYIFVVGPDERTLCHPNPAIIGTPEKDIVDANGKKVGELISVAAHRTGGGWVEYVWPRPGQTTPVKKSTFATRVKGPDGKWYIVGSGAYEAK